VQKRNAFLNFEKLGVTADRTHAHLLDFELDLDESVLDLAPGVGQRKAFRNIVIE
jgi:hypothetical protein